MMQPAIKWSGSKRSQTQYIIPLIPPHRTYYEPFVGGGAVLYALHSQKAVCGDICAPLIALWNRIKYYPTRLADSYESRWNRLQTEGQDVYYEIRDRFNKEQSPEDFLFLTRTCVNGLTRFNAKGEFNNSFHLSRKGIQPDSLREILLDWSSHIKGARFVHGDYETTTRTAVSGDFVYLDPPYAGTKGMYYGTLDYDRFFRYLGRLNDKGIMYALSFDGIRGDSDYTIDVPKDLYKRHLYLPSGNSTFRKVQGNRTEKVLESLYLNY